MDIDNTSMIPLISAETSSIGNTVLMKIAERKRKLDHENKMNHSSDVTCHKK